MSVFKPTESVYRRQPRVVSRSLMGMTVLEEEVIVRRRYRFVLAAREVALGLPATTPEPLGIIGVSRYDRMLGGLDASELRRLNVWQSVR